jgi:hypothetical protein
MREPAVFDKVRDARWVAALRAWPTLQDPNPGFRGACHRAGHFGRDPLARLLTVLSLAACPRACWIAICSIKGKTWPSSDNILVHIPEAERFIWEFSKWVRAIFRTSATSKRSSTDRMQRSGIPEFKIGLKLTDQNAGNTSGPCQVTLNGKTDNAASYKADAQKLTIKTSLHDSPLEIYKSKNGTQVDHISDHHIWIG